MFSGINLKKITIIFVLVWAFFLGSCFPVNHVRLGSRYRKDMNRYESLKEKEVSPNARQSLDYAGQYLDEARKANRRWDNTRAKLLLKLVEGHLDRVESPAQIPQGLIDIYNEMETATPEADLPY